MISTPEMEVAVKYGSHMPALLACVAVTDGPVLELGVGHFSTPQLHAFCGAMGRALVSVELDEVWRHEFSRWLSSPRAHSFYSGIPLEMLVEKRYGVALIDHSPGGANRAAAFKALIDVCDYVVMHDAQRDAENFEHVAPMLDGLHWHLCTGYFPHTLVCSRTRQIPEVLLNM